MAKLRGLPIAVRVIVGLLIRTLLRGIPVVTSTRVFPTSAGIGSPLALKKMGCVLADNLSPQKARILLMLALLQTSNCALIQKYFGN